MSRNQMTARVRHASALKALRQVLNQQASPSRVGPIDYDALGAARLNLLDASSCHSVRVLRAHYQRALQLENQIQASWCRIRPAMQEVGQLLDANGVENLYWIGPLSQGSACPDEFFEFMFPPWVPDALMDDLVVGIYSLMEKHARDEFIQFQDWDTLTTAQQTRWAARAIPLFRSVNPTCNFK